MLTVLFAALLHAAWNALIKSGSDKLLDSVMLCAGAGVMALAVLPFLPLPAAASRGYLIASTLIHVGYFCLVALAYRSADLSFIYPLMRGAAPLFTALIMVLGLGEPLAFGGWLGVALLCAGVISLALDGHRAANIPRRAWAFGLANAAVIVSYTVIDGAGARAAGHAWSYVLWLFALTALPMIAVGWALRGRAMASLPFTVWRKGLVSGACSIAAYGLALWAMTQAPIALVAALRETSVLFGTALAALLLHEKFGRARWLAAALMVAGAAAMKVF
jgi:drug/metabolite transporter (DMT)-like permease